MPRVPRSLRRIVSVLAVVLVVEYLVLPQIAGARRALELLGRVRLQYVLAGVALEIAAQLAYASLTRSVLPERAKAPRLPTLARIQLATRAVSNVLPGGAAAGGALGFRLLTRAGVNETDAAFALATQSIGSAVVLNVLLWLGLVVSIPARGFHPLYVTAAVVGLVLVGGFALIVLALTRGEERAVTVMRAVARRVPILDVDAMEKLVRDLAGRLRTLVTDPALLARTIGWSAAFWLLDAASLWVFVYAFGHGLGFAGLVVAYGLAYVLAAVPVTPGGLGVVEAVLTSSLVGFGAPRAIAVLGVISYRVVNFWLPIPLGAAAYLSLRLLPGAGPSEELRQVAEQAAKESEDIRTWAQRHGVRVPRQER